MKDWFHEQMAMYTAYHRDPRNCATHYVGVPLIVFALLVGMSVVSFGSVAGIPVTFATLFLAALMLLYVLAVPVVGFIASIVHAPLLWLAHLVAGEGPQTLWIVAALCFFGGWVIQFVGHIFEGRRPALFDNLLQVFMAPGFLVAEALFAAGLLPALKNDLQERSVKYAASQAEQQ